MELLITKMLIREKNLAIGKYGASCATLFIRKNQFGLLSIITWCQTQNTWILKRKIMIGE